MSSDNSATSTTVDIQENSEAAAGATATASDPHNEMNTKIEVDENATISSEDNKTGAPLPPGGEDALDAIFASNGATANEDTESKTTIEPKFEIVPAKATEGVRTTPLNDQELKDLLECETTIDRAMQGFVDLGKAMAKIRDNKLFEPAYKSFPDYLDKRWGYTRQYAWNIINASDAYIALAERINKEKLPKSERAMRALLKAPSEKRSEVLDIAAKAGEPTTERIIEAIATVIPKKAKMSASKAKPKRVIKPEDAIKAGNSLADFLEECDINTLLDDQRKSIENLRAKLANAFNKLPLAA